MKEYTFEELKEVFVKKLQELGEADESEKIYVPQIGANIYFQRRHELFTLFKTLYPATDFEREFNDAYLAGKAKMRKEYNRLKREQAKKKRERTNTIDLTNHTCLKCNKGTYKEGGVFDDMDGMVTCEACGDRIKRWFVV